MISSLRTRRLLVLAACCGAVAVLVAGCGGGGSSSESAPAGDVAVIDGQPISETTLNKLVQQSLDSLKAQKQPLPKEGTPEYKQLQDRIVAYLVQKTEVEQQAKKLGVVVTAKNMRDAYKAFLDQYFKGSEKKFQDAVKKAGVTRASVMANLRFTTLQQQLVKKLTQGLDTTEDEARNYYLEHAPDYSKDQTRHVEHILVKTKVLADKIYDQLQKGANFATLAKKYTLDTNSKARGGDLGDVEKGSLVREFANVAFDQSLKPGQTAKPVKSSYGWHVIRALGPVKPRSVIPFKSVKAQIIQQLDTAKRSGALSKFQTKLEKYYATRVIYGKSFAPPTATTSTTPSFSIPTETVSTG